MESNICNICTETFNKSTRTLVKCKCDFESCKQCVRTYLSSCNDEPTCMSCKVIWDINFLQENFDKKFINNEYKKHRENVLFEREKGMLQATQVYVEKEIKTENLKEEIEKIQKEYIKKVNKLKKELKEVENNEIIEKRKFIRRCPNNECKGFLSSSLKCELCNCYACSKCREISGFTREEKERHECKKEIVESIKLLEKDSKPCPKCASLIFKVEGCDQMFCVECHCVFSWKTLKIDNGKIHNPHYYEYQRNINNGIAPRDPMDIQCGRELDMNFMTQLQEIFKPKLPRGWKINTIRREIDGVGDFEEIVYISPSGKIQKNHPGGYNNIVKLCRRIIHIRNVDQARFRGVDILNKNLQSRIDYMRNKISEDKFRKIIHRREKEESKRQEINNILGMFVMAFTDLFYRLADTRDNNILDEMEELRKYTNKCLEKTSKTYNCKKYVINEMYKFE